MTAFVAYRKVRAFTLVELLVVIGILLLLSALLFPTMAGARKQALVTELTHQLRQVDLAHRLYLDGHDEIFLAHRPVTNSLRQMNQQALAVHSKDKTVLGSARTYYERVGFDGRPGERLGEFQYMLDLLPRQTLFVNLTLQAIERGEPMRINAQEVSGVSAAVPYAAFLMSKDGDLTAPERYEQWIDFLADAQSVRVWTNGRIDTVRHPARRVSVEHAFLSGVVTPYPLGR